MSKVIDARWYAGRDCVGIIQVVEDHQLETYRQTGEATFKYYIGVGLGADEKSDRQNIANWGTPFDVLAGNALFGVNAPLKNKWS